MTAAAEVTRGAWVREEENFYGAGRFPFGPCSECEEPACFDVPGDNGSRRVCLKHKPSHLHFVPFLGQQTKIFSATERWVLAGGGAGGSKTYAGARLWMKQYFPELERYRKAKAAGRSFTSKGWTLFLRRTIPELTQVIEDFKKYYLLVDPKARWDQQQKFAIFECGFKVQFGGMENEDDYLKYYGGEYTLVVADEASQFTEKQLEEIDTRIRCSDPVLDRKLQFYMLTNPVGRSRDYLRARYVRPAPPETRVQVETTLADGRLVREWQVYIPSNLYDNPALMASGRYEAKLARAGANRRRALLLNDWDVGEGMWIGDDWDPRYHVVKPHPIPNSYSKFKMADYGYSSRTAIHWAAMDPEGGMIVYRSRSYRKLTADQLADAIKAEESRPLTWKDPKTGKVITIVEPEWDQRDDCSTVMGPLDASCWDNNGHEMTIGGVLESKGCGFFRSKKGPHIRHFAADQARSRLTHRYPDPRNPKQDLAGLRFFEGTTESRIVDAKGNPEITGPTHTIPSLPADEKDPDVWDTNANDHDMDALAYGVTIRPMSTEPEEEAQVYDFMVIKAEKAGAATKIAW